MKAVLVRVTDQDLALRRKLGLDRRDEMWEGVLHMTPAPSYEHQRILGDLLEFLRPLLRETRRGTLTPEINVYHSDDDYRIPDLVFVAAGRESLLQKDGVRGGGPEAVIEIRSADDETYEKLPFFATVGVREAVVIDRDSKKPEIFRLAGAQYVAVAADREGWLTAETLRVRFRLEAPRLLVQDAENPSARREI